MRKILKLFVPFLILLSSCGVKNVENDLLEYNNIVKNSENINSYSLDIDSNHTVSNLSDSGDLINERNTEYKMSILNDKLNNNYYFSTVNEKADYVMSLWYVDGIVYLNNSGYKISYNQQKQDVSYLNKKNGIKAIELTEDEVESVKTSKLDNKITYDFKLNELGRKKFLMENEYLGYGTTFVLEESLFEYKVVTIDNVVVQVIVSGMFQGKSIGEKNRISFYESALYGKFNDVKVEKPIDSLDYTNINLNKTLKEYSVEDLNSYKSYLIDIGYAETEGLYTLNVGNVNYTYDFKNNTFSSTIGNTVYNYNYLTDDASNEVCVYSFKNVSETTCDNTQIVFMINLRNNFLYDVSGTNIIDYSILNEN